MEVYSPLRLSTCSSRRTTYGKVIESDRHRREGAMTVSHQPLVNDALLTPLLSALEEVRRWATDALRQVDSYHGVLHAQAVANNIALLCNSSDIPLAKAEEIALRIAAWLHDVGYAQYSPNWSQDRREHV